MRSDTVRRCNPGTTWSSSTGLGVCGINVEEMQICVGLDFLGGNGWTAGLCREQEGTLCSIGRRKDTVSNDIQSIKLSVFIAQVEKVWLTVFC